MMESIKSRFISIDDFPIKIILVKYYYKITQYFIYNHVNTLITEYRMK